MKLKSWWEVLRESLRQFSEHRVLRLAAATAYYATFSIGPLLVLIIGLAGLAFGEENVTRQVHQQLQGVVGEKSAHLISSMMSAQKKGGSLLATIIGGIAVVLGASGVFGQLQDSLNTIWGVVTKPDAGLGALIRDRLFSMATVLGTGFLLLISMILSTLVNAFSRYLGNLVSVPSWVAPTFNEVVSLVVIAALFGLIFKVLPDVKLRWRDVWLGAGITAVLFTAGKFLLGFYLSREAGASAYGAGSAFVVILLYVYYSSLILYFGAEFTQVYARRQGAGTVPTKYAVHMTDAQRAAQGIPREEQLQPANKPRLQAERAVAVTGKVGAPTSVPNQDFVKEEKMRANKDEAPQKGSPAERIKARPWTFVGIALVGGLVTGMVWRIKGLRRALSTFSTIAAGATKAGKGSL
jgi:membrane protein